ncbi:MAG: hypothetical protein AAFR65_01000 [Pseudomonadota bacterium]
MPFVTGFARLIVGIIVMFAVQFALSRLWGMGGVSWGPDALPVTPVPQFAALSTTAAALFFGAAAIIIASGRRASIPFHLFWLIGVAIDGYVMGFVETSLPLWFRVTFVGLIPLSSFLALLLLGARSRV